MSARALLVALAVAGGCARPAAVVVGSKKFTESVIVGELATILLREAGLAARHQPQLGGTRILWNALRAGDIDVYPEYTGTLCQEILRTGCDEPSLRRALAAEHVMMSPSLGFSDGYALALRAELAARLGLGRISDLAAHPELRFGFSDEFLARGDGWPALRARYRLPHKDVRALDHDLAWRGLAAGTLDLIDAYDTDAELRYYAPRLLVDDRHHFTEYQAVLLYRDDLPDAARAALGRLSGAIARDDMVALNARVKLDRRAEAAVAGEFSTARLGVHDTREADGWWRRLLRRTGEHLMLVGLSLAGAILLGVPLGIVAARRRRLGQLILGAAGLMQTQYEVAYTVKHKLLP